MTKLKMKYQNSNSVATVILISLLTGCSGFSYASTAELFQTAKISENIVLKFSTLASIAIVEFTDCPPDSVLHKCIFIFNAGIV